MLPGVGPKAREQFDELNIRWISDIAAMELQHLKLAFGRFGLLLHQRAFGIDHSPVRPAGGVPAVVREKILPEDTNDYEMLRGIVFGLCVEACEQMRATCSRSARVELTLRYSDYREDSGAEKLTPPLQSETALQARVERLLGKVMKRRTRVRLVILKLTELRRGCVQLELFPDTRVTRRARLEYSLDHLRRRFGASAIETGTGYAVPEKSGRRLQWPNSISGTA
jgi:DNA polymerase-4